MAGVKKTKKEDVINACIEIIRKEGEDALNVRRIAKEIGCSTQPIYYTYSNLEELKKDVFDEVSKIFYEYMYVRNYDKVAYKDIGKNYLVFAKEESNLFKLLFNNKVNETLNSFVDLTGPARPIRDIIAKQTGLNEEETLRFHLKMWIAINGVAVLLLNNTYQFTDEEIEKLLTEEFHAEILYEIEKGNMKREMFDMMLKNKLRKLSE